MTDLTTGSTIGNPPGAAGDERIAWFRSFRPHFDLWVIGPIDRLVSRRECEVAFIMMALAVDYLAGFWYGEDTKGKTRQAYAAFIMEYFTPGRYDPAALYDSLRNGLVHMFTIKHGAYVFVQDHPEWHLVSFETGQIILNASSFRDDVVAAKDKYFNEVEGNLELLKKAWERFERDGFLSARVMGGPT